MFSLVFAAPRLFVGRRRVSRWRLAPDAAAATTQLAHAATCSAHVCGSGASVVEEEDASFGAARAADEASRSDPDRDERRRRGRGRRAGVVVGARGARRVVAVVATRCRVFIGVAIGSAAAWGRGGVRRAASSRGAD